MFTYFYIATAAFWFGYWVFYFTRLVKTATTGLVTWALFVTFCPGFNMVAGAIVLVAIAEKQQVWKRKLW